jgi:predicted peroxiredoxin
MAANQQKVVITLTAGLDDAERATVALLLATAALNAGKQVILWLTKEAVRFGLSAYGEAVACDGCPPLSRLLEQYADGGGELLVCPVCFSARQLDEAQLTGNARLAGATPLWQWIGGDEATVFSY